MRYAIAIRFSFSHISVLHLFSLAFETFQILSPLNWPAGVKIIFALSPLFLGNIRLR